MTKASETQVPKKARDLRLDFFRGLAMFIILLAHTPGNPWTLWIPARFGFSDATEIFVFCSGMASALAFGTVYLNRSWWLGSARIVFRIWQVYWAHVGVFLVIAGMMVVLHNTGLGTPDKDYTRWFPIGGLFTRTEETLVGLFTLTYIPGLFDILPMYLVILAMVPVLMGIYAAAGRTGVFVFMGVVWLMANLGGYARIMAGAEEMTALQSVVAGLGQNFLWMNLPGIPWLENATWFFSPFAWQLVFFTGFCFGMGWIPAPPVTRSLVILAIVVVVATLPFAWHKMYQYLTGFIPENAVSRWLWDARETIEPLRWKTWIGGWRYLHFLAVGYLAWAAVGPGGIRLTTGWDVIRRSVGTRQVIAAVSVLALVLTAPWTWLAEIKLISPALDRWSFENLAVDGRYHGIFNLIHLAAAIALIWHSVGDRARTWIARDAFLAVVPVIRKVGTQSLAVFLVSLVVARFNGWWMDAMSVGMDQSGYFTARDVWMVGMVNMTGCAALIATAYIVGWFRRQPWRERPAPRQTGTSPMAAVPAE